MSLVEAAQFGAQQLSLLLLRLAHAFENAVLNGLSKVQLEGVKAAKNFGLNQIKDAPQLVEVVLQRRAAEEKADAAHAQRNQVTSQHCVEALRAVPLVDNQHVVAQLAEVNALGAHHAKGGHQDAALPFQSLDLTESF